MALAITAAIFAIGNILFGHFEEHTPKWRRVAKVIVVLALVGTLSHFGGAWWGLAPVGLMLVGVMIIHGWWLPRLGINGWTAEPKEKYYALRGWKLDANATSPKEK